MEEMSVEGTHIRDISCTLIPGEEVVFSVYEGPSAAAVRRFNERAGIPLSRIVEAIAVASDDVDLQVKYSRGQANIILVRKGAAWITSARDSDGNNSRREPSFRHGRR